MKILIIALSGIGNLIMSFPMIQTLKENFPKIEIDFLVTLRGTKELLENQYFVNKIFVLTSQTIKDLFFNKQIKKLIKQLRLNDYDIAVTIYPSQGIFSAILMKLIKAKNRIQHKYNFKVFKNICWFLTYSPKIENKHSVYMNLDLIKVFSIKHKSLQYSYHLSKSSTRFANKFVKENNLKNKFIIGIHPGTKNDMIWRRWSIENWQKLIKIFNKKCVKIKFLVFLGPDEIGYEKYFKNIRNVIIVKDMSLKNTIALMSKCDYFISNDSGLSHCASLFNIPQSVIFGGASYIHTAPFSNKANIITPPNYEIFYIPYFGFVKEPKNLLIYLKASKVYSSIKKHMTSLNILK